ncbi:MAG: tetratricopeptide repeat protein [Candidatus Nitrohelix vancouverensis]|uniref:Tetratricopeptide repeat protein n=1 Tax=Candidatus Nitrohelix vancouverensis TaxID=2705534 RepID=A0A7T0G2U6_9BACT|nr:MAG: tetratricopeptide repeat protein [Candidatus Nitrohelix vancouverensis]
MQDSPVIRALSILLALTLIVFLQIVQHDFVGWDDPVYVYGNIFVAQGLTWEGFSWGWNAFEQGNWHPLTWWSHMLDTQLFGLEPGATHAVNLALHSFNCSLLFLFFYSATRRFYESLGVAILFAVHPMHVESVAWASERKDLLSSFFWILAMIAHARYARQPNRGMQAVVFFCMTLGLMAKATLIALPLILLILDFWPLNRYPDRSWKSPEMRRFFLKCLVEKIPLFILSIIGSALAMYAQSHAGAVTDLPLVGRLAHVLLNYADYIEKFFWPLQLAPLYPFRAGYSAPLALLALAALTAITFAAFRYARAFPWALAGWLWFLIALLPVVGLVKIGAHSIADRYSYLAYIGLSIPLCWSLGRLAELEARSKKWIAAFSLSILLCLTLMAQKQASYWKNSESLFQRALAVTQNNYLMHDYLGVAYFREERFEEAGEQFRESVRINPYYAKGRLSLGGYYYTVGEWELAEKEFQAALDLNPSLEQAREYRERARMEQIQELPEVR